MLLCKWKRPSSPGWVYLGLTLSSVSKPQSLASTPLAIPQLTPEFTKYPLIITPYMLPCFSLLPRQKQSLPRNHPRLLKSSRLQPPPCAVPSSTTLILNRGRHLQTIHSRHNTSAPPSDIARFILYGVRRCEPG